jgi:hypothetical protein
VACQVVHTKCITIGTSQIAQFHCAPCNPLTEALSSGSDNDMKAYKFRSVENLHFIIDIIFNKRLYCCPSQQLNDIRETDVRVGTDHSREIEIIDFGNIVTQQIRELRVCSLSKSFNNHLLWTHYSGGYTGVVIEVDLPDEDTVDVIYDNNFIFLSNFIDKASPEDTARNVLSIKYKDWIYEEEVRVITKSEFYELTRPISRIIVGSRMSSTLIHALQLVCNHFDVKLDRIVIADWGIYTVAQQQL